MLRPFMAARDIPPQTVFTAYIPWGIYTPARAIGILGQVMKKACALGRLTIV
jgi:hypothetical protein